MTAWMDEAACIGVDPDLFFPGRGESTEPAKKVCAGCDVRAECLAYALANVEMFGVWGGKSEKERRKMRSKIRGGGRGPVPGSRGAQRCAEAALDQQARLRIVRAAS